MLGQWNRSQWEKDIALLRLYTAHYISGNMTRQFFEDQGEKPKVAKCLMLVMGLLSRKADDIDNAWAHGATRLKLWDDGHLDIERVRQSHR